MHALNKLSISWQKLSFGPCRPRNNFFKDAYQVFDKIPQLEKKKPCLECLSPLRVESGNYPLSHSPSSVKEGTTVRALCHFLS